VIIDAYHRVAPEPMSESTRLRAYRLPDPPAEPGFEDFRPFHI